MRDFSGELRAKGTITANTAHQLQTKTWAQLQYWHKLCITRHWFEITTEKMYARDQSDKIFDVSEGGCTDGEPHMYLFGNPTQNSGKFYRVNFGSERNGWNHRSVDSRTSRFTNKALIAEWAERYGEDSDWFRYPVKGEAPRVGFSAFPRTRWKRPGSTKRKASPQCRRSWQWTSPDSAMTAA